MAPGSAGTASDGYRTGPAPHTCPAGPDDYGPRPCPCHTATTDGREPRQCPKCGQACKYDGWGHVHTDGLGIGSCRTATSLRPVDSGGRRRGTEDRVRELVEAGALIAAEIDRIRRALGGGSRG